jgi:hypothetical protein
MLDCDWSSDVCSSDLHIQRVVIRLIESGVWQKDMRLSAESVARYQDMMLAYGLFDEPADLEAIGINRRELTPN